MTKRLNTKYKSAVKPDNALNIDQSLSILWNTEYLFKKISKSLYLQRNIFHWPLSGWGCQEYLSLFTVVQ